jgi:ribosomal protein S18 acetylase RimI-like enzyme
VKLRRAAPADAPALVERWAAMYAELGASPADDELRVGFAGYLRRKLPAPDFAAWVVEDGAEVVATASLILYEIPGRAGVTHEAYVVNVYTLPRFRGRGLARQLMDALLAHARTLPVRKLWLRTAPKARGVYEQLGFEGRPEFMEKDLKDG